MPNHYDEVTKSFANVAQGTTKLREKIDTLERDVCALEDAINDLKGFHPQPKIVVDVNAEAEKYRDANRDKN